MSSSQNKLTEQIRVHFFQPNGIEVEDCGDEIKMAFQDCLEAGLNPKWISEEEAVKLKDKKDVIIFDKFEGDVFEKLKKQKCVRICGPRCIRICLSENSPIPETNSPIYMTAMRGVVVTATNVDSNMKIKLKEKVSYMGGLYLNNLVESVTHLVCGGVYSPKYNKAVERSLSLMSVEWIDAVWKEGLKRNVHATDSEFQQYKCPIFLNLEITASNISSSEKNELKNIINSNGGIYSGQLRQKFTAILIINDNPNTSDKYRHAKSWNLPCVKSSWVYESLKKGHLVSSEGHLISNAVRCSTPTEDKDELPSFAGSDISVVSSVGFAGIASNKSNVDESVLTNVTVPYLQSAPRDKRVTKSNDGDQAHKKVVESLNLADAKKAGPFLDGCKVYLSGFTAQEQDKLRRILNVGGAVIFTELTDAVSHVIAGDFVAADGILISKAINRPHVVGIEWLVASLKQGSPALESMFSRMESKNNKQILPEPPSPLSQKGLQLLKKGEFKAPSSVGSSEKKKENELNRLSSSTSSTDKVNSDSSSNIPPVNRNLFQDFVKNDASKSTVKISDNEERRQQPMNVDNEYVNNGNDMSTSSTGGPTNIFKDLVFMILGFDSDITAEIDEAIVNYGGSVVAQSFRGMTDYTVVPLYGAPVTGIQSEVVTPYWLDDCCESNSVVPIQYYHLPLSIAGNRTPLEGCVVTLSVYSLRERKFLSELVVALGALCQEIFARKTNVNKGVHGNTHLVVPTSGSSKYNAAIKWNIPVVTKDWLLACAKLGSRAPEEPYLVTSKDEVSSKTDEVSSKNSSHQALETPQREMGVSVMPIGNSVTPKRPDSLKNNEPISNQTPSATTSANTVNNWATSASCNLSVNNILSPGNVLKSAKSSRNGDSNSANFNSPKVRKLSENSTPVRSYENISTPETPYEEAVGETGKTARKRIKRWIDRIDAGKQKDPLPAPPPARRKSTPLSELMRQAFRKFGNTPDDSFVDGEKNENSEVGAMLGVAEIGDGERPASNNDTPPPSFSAVLNEKLAELKKQISTTSKVPARISSGSSKDLNDVESSSASSGSNIRINPNFDSQVNQVGWEEPVETAEKAKILGVVPAGTSNPENKKFVISNVKDNKKEDYTKMIKSLGATLLCSDRYSFETTHLLTDRPIRSEKLLCSIAAGRWVLHVSYLEESYKATTFLPEEDFEWGNPRSKENIPPLKVEIEIGLANAAFRWRSSLQGCDSGAFDGMRAVLCINNKRLAENLGRLIKAGMGILLDVKEIMEATHCFINADDYEGIDFKALASKNIYCLPPIYLSNYLTEYPTPDPMDSTVDEYRKYCRQKL